MSRRQITTLGNVNKATLRNYFGFKSIIQAKKELSEFGGDTDAKAYEIMKEKYNEIVKQEQLEKKKNKAKEVKAQKTEDMKINKSIILDLKHGKVDEKTYETQIRNKLLSASAKLVGKKFVYIKSSIDGILFEAKLQPITSKNPLTIFWDNVLPYIETYVDGKIKNIFQDCKDYARIVIFDSETTLPFRLRQQYLDGEKHCVIEPLRLTFQTYADNCKTKDSKRKMVAVVNKLNEFEKKYSNGVPEEDLEIIGKAISRCIIIHNLIGGETKKYNSNSTKYMHFTNTRNNHLDFGFLSVSGKYENVSQAQMNSILSDHEDKNEFYMMDGDVDGKVASMLSSALGNWRVVNEDYEIYKEFDKLIGKKNYGLEAVEYSELNEFIKEARIINASPTPLCDDPNDLTDIHHLDVSKAYTQHRFCKFYRGFLGHIYSYSKLDNITNPLEFIKNHIGIYQVKIIKNKNELLKQLGIFENQIYTLPSVEIIAFIEDFNVSVKLVAGCYGSEFDFDYTDEILENRRYAIWAGKLGQDKDYTKYTFSGNREWAKHLKHELGNDNVYYFNDWNMITIKIDKKQYQTHHHILAFITSYTRLNMLEIMKNIKGELTKVILDGIYYRGEVNDVVIPHKLDKELKTHLGFREHWYYPTMIDTSNWAKYNSNFDGNCVLAGAGGTGKTYSVYNYKGLIKPLYVVPSHILGKKMRNEYNCDYTTINRLVGDDCVSYKEMFREPHTILIDELTMTNKPLIEKAIEMYPDSLILLAGDIDDTQWYQCRNGTEGLFNEVYMPKAGNQGFPATLPFSMGLKGNDSSLWRYVYYTDDKRSKDEEIKNLKQSIRKQMKEIFETGGIGEAKTLELFIEQNYKVVDFCDAVKEFRTGDIWLAGTHRTNKNLLDNGIISGYINNKKEINSSEGIARGSFTIHSYQGLTIEKEKVFISLDTFEYAMLYTAVSRCCNMNQIVFVRD